MKRITWIYLAVLAWMAGACVEEEKGVRIAETPVAPQWISPSSGSAQILTAEDAEQEIEFLFEEANYGFQAAVDYSLQMDYLGNDFETAIELGTGNVSPIWVTVAQLNQALLQLGAETDETVEVELRIRARINENVMDEYSDVQAFTYTPYSVALDYSRLHLPGDYQGWNVENENTVIFDIEGEGVYEGYIHVLSGSGEFKITEGPSWDVNYGDNEGNGTLDLDGDNLVVENPSGTYLLTVDLKAMSYELGGAMTWGLVGDATPGGWDADTPLAFDADENVLTLTLDLNAGELKFRANNDWGHNYGDDGGDGILNPDGDNIQIEEAGNYTVTMDWKTPGEVSYEVVKN